MALTREEIYEDIEQTIGFVPQWLTLLSDKTLAQEWELIKNWEMAETAVPSKYKELIGLAVAAQMQCAYCVAFHTEMARLHGASESEIEDAVHMAKHTAGWSSYLQGMQVDLSSFKREVKEICDALAAKRKAA